MSVGAWTFTFVTLSFALYIGVAVWSRARSTGDFYVAGGRVRPLVNGMATAADWMSAASFLSMAGLIAFMGRDGAVYLMGWTGGYVLLALLLAPYLRKFGKYTVPDFVGDRYYSQTARVVAVVCAVFVSFTYVAGQMRGVGIVFSRFLNVGVDTGVAIGMAVVLFYAVLGGMKGEDINRVRAQGLRRLFYKKLFLHPWQTFTLLRRFLRYMPLKDIWTLLSKPFKGKKSGATRAEVLSRAVEHADMKTAAADLTQVPDDKLEETLQKSGK
jgi:hypothetical protein